MNTWMHMKDRWSPNMQPHVCTGRHHEVQRQESVTELAINKRNIVG